VSRAGLPQALEAEWIKLRSVRSSAWTLLVAFALSLLGTFVMCSGTTTEGGSPGRPGDNDIVRDSLTGVWLGQIVIAVLAVLLVTSEYSSGTIRATFAAIPRRRVVLMAKSCVTGALVLVVGLLTATACFVLGQSLLRGNGFDYAGGYPHASLTDGPALRAVAGSGLYLACLALLALGLAAIVRHTATAITVVLGLMFVPAIAAGILPERLSEPLLKFSPMTAGLAVQETVDRADGIPIGPWAGLGVLGTYALGALIVAAWLIQRRDA
jgi:ABC-2 type transport system permease protein